MGKVTSLILLVVSVALYVLSNVFNDAFMLFYAIFLVMIAKGNGLLVILSLLVLISIAGIYYLNGLFDYRMVLLFAIMLSLVVYTKYSYVPKLLKQGEVEEFNSLRDSRSLPLFVYRAYTEEN